MKSPRFLRVGSHWILFAGLVLGLVLTAPVSSRAAEAKPKRGYTPRPVRGQTTPTPTNAEPIVIEGTMRSSMGYPRVFARVFRGGQAVTGRPAQDVIQRARALGGDYLDLNLAASSGPQSWWTAVLDTGAENHSVNRDTADRFGLANIVSGLTLTTGVDGEDIKGSSWIYGLSLAGSDGRLHELPSQPFFPVQAEATFTLELRPYQPERRVSPAGANLIGMAAIRELLAEIDNENATIPMLAEPIDMSSARAFEESLQSITAGPRVRFQPPAFRPTNNLVRIPLRYLDAHQLFAGKAAGPATPLATTPFVLGVRTLHGSRQALGNFVLDTGSPVTLISRRLAYQLGLITGADPAADQPDFNSQFSGINDRDVNAAGFVIDSLALRSPDGRVVEWRKLPVVVHDVAIRQANGAFVVHDGILGSNLFMASTNGEIDERGLKLNPPPFARYWIHGPLGELWLPIPVPAVAGR